MAQGGHDVPEADVRRRYERTVARFWDTYRTLAGDWMLVDNGGDSFVRIAGGQGTGIVVYDEEAWARFVGLRDLAAGERDDE